MDLFLQLLQISIRRHERFTQAPSDKQWGYMLYTAVKQALVGICGTGIELLPPEQRPPQEIAMRWAFLVDHIEQQNALMNRKCEEVTEAFRTINLRTCILKGQEIALLYPNPSRRQPGDIDLFCRPLYDVNTPRILNNEEIVLKEIRRVGKLGKVVYHHAELQAGFERDPNGRVVFYPEQAEDDVKLEVHYRFSWFYSPLRNKRFQRWSRRGVNWSLIEKSPDGTFSVPTLEFNIVYILTHLYRHLFDEGIGLRQLLDYYYVVIAFRPDEVKGEEVRDTLSKLGLCKFCSAVMYVMHRTLGLEESRMLLPMNEKEGRFLLSEIMQAGNLGQYDNRSRPEYNESIVSRFLRRQKRIARFLIHYPEEAICSPFWTVWHWLWRKHKRYL